MTTCFVIVSSYFIKGLWCINAQIICRTMSTNYKIFVAMNLSKIKVYLDKKRRGKYRKNKLINKQKEKPDNKKIEEYNSGSAIPGNIVRQVIYASI